MAERKILIAGGGIGGLAAAACLLQNGIDVTVFEQAPAFGEVGAGIQLSANAMRVMRHIGVDNELAERGFQPETYLFKLYDSMETLQEIPLGKSYEGRHGVPYISIHRVDLLDALVEKVRSLKADAVRLNSPVEGYEEDGSGATLHLQNGESVRGDTLIGADGIRSAIRNQIVGTQPVHYTGDQCWRVLVPAERLTGLRNMTTVNICVGPDKHGVVYPIRPDGLINFVGAVEYDDHDEESWTNKRPWTEMKADFEGWHEDVQDLIDQSDRDACYRWTLNDRRPVTNWSTERATLLGDAAHPTLPYMAQGAAMAIEDAAVIARCLSTRSDISDALQLYQRNRMERTARIVTESAANRTMFHLPSVTALKDAFAKRNMNKERNDWLFSYDALNVPLN